MTHPDLTRDRMPSSDPGRAARMFGIGTAAFGVLLGVAWVLGKFFQDNPTIYWILFAVFLVLLIGVSIWQQRASRGVPRAANQVAMIAVGATFIIAMLGTMYLNHRFGADVTPPAPWLLGIGVGMALPMVLAGLAVASRAER